MPKSQKLLLVVAENGTIHSDLGKGYRKNFDSLVQPFREELAKQP